ncbi:MAG: M28 family peptidase [Bacteroidales bacterium]|nr:M28 family peptidase [Bacteroidales bacterium]
MRKHNFVVLCACAALVAGTANAQMQNLLPERDTLMNHIRNLSSSQYEGRLSGSEGYWRAAEYAIQSLARYGVQPYQGDWSQLFETECNEVKSASLLTYLNQNDTRTVYVLGRDFSCAGMTGRGYANADVVFCGYGIDNGTFDEYANVDAQGKIVLCLSGVPSWLPSDVTKNYASLRDKARTAHKHGACALIAINMSPSCPDDEPQARVYCGEPPHLPTFPILQPTKSCGRALMADEKMTLDSAVSLLESTMTPQSFHLRKHIETKVETRYQPASLTGNIVGIYPGTDNAMKNEYVVVGAHLDHAGMQGKTCIFPGADQNASGVAILLETARLLKQAEEQPDRSIIFVLFGSGEQQYLGSQIFVSNFTPLKRIEVFVNLENLGGGDSVAALGDMKYPGLWDVAHQMDTTYTHFLYHRSKSNPKGNALAFDAIGIPSLSFTNFNGERHNHVPSDIAENIDRSYLTRAAKLVFETVYELSFGNYQGRSALSRKYRFE